MLEGYEIIDKLTRERFKLIGLSEFQKDSFDYLFCSSLGCEKYSIHISHFLYGGCIIVYNKSYILKSNEIIYLLKDLGGCWDEGN